MGFPCKALSPCRCRNTKYCTEIMAPIVGIAGSDGYDCGTRPEDYSGCLIRVLVAIYSAPAPGNYGRGPSFILEGPLH